jgi:hypothetical protein
VGTNTLIFNLSFFNFRIASRVGVGVGVGVGVTPSSFYISLRTCCGVKGILQTPRGLTDDDAVAEAGAGQRDGLAQEHYEAENTEECHQHDPPRGRSHEPAQKVVGGEVIVGHLFVQPVDVLPVKHRAGGRVALTPGGVRVVGCMVF